MRGLCILSLHPRAVELCPSLQEAENVEKLLPDLLKDLWKSVENNHMTRSEFGAEQERLIDGYRAIWTQALLLGTWTDLRESLLAELIQYSGCGDQEEIQQRCAQALSDVRSEWKAMVSGPSRESIEQFYHESQAMLYELMWWHTLCEDLSPLAYVVALRFAQGHGCQRFLDFGAGVCSGPILFARDRFDVSVADISSPMLDFGRWRFDLRKLNARFIDLKAESLPADTFDFVAAMDVFEHLVDPVGAADDLWRALNSGGFLFGRFHADVDEERPHHIVQDFGPTLRHLHELGFVEVWKDEWLWGHQVFQKQ